MSLKDLKNTDTLVGMFIKNMDHENLLNECLYSIAMQDEPVNLILLHDGLSPEAIDKLNAIAKNPTIYVKGKKVKVTKEDGTEEEKDEVITESAGNSLNYTVEEVAVKNFADIFNAVFQRAVDNGYKFMSVAEPEDVFSLRWFELAAEWHKENPEISMFLPLIKHMHFGVFHGFMNESCWAEGVYDPTIDDGYIEELKADRKSVV